LAADICIVGGGLVGLTAALAFAAQGRSVVLIEAIDPEINEPARLDARSLALSHSSMQIYRSLGLASRVEAASAAIRHIHVSSAGRFGVTRLAADDMGLSAMGQVIEYHVLWQLLVDALRANDAIRLISPASVVAISSDEKGVNIEYSADKARDSLSASLVVAADGANSPLREMLGIGANVRDFGQSAIIANVQVEGKASGVAYERFTASGPLASLPLPDSRYALVWSNRPERAQALMQMGDDEFIGALHKNFGYRLGQFKAVGQRAVFPLKMTRAEELVSERVVIIGNAANTLHPVAGQGLNLALRDIAALFDLVKGRDLQGDDLPSHLANYPDARKADQNATVNLSSSLVQLFSNDFAPLAHARGAGLAALDLCPTLKQEFSWLGMGFGSGCSSLMRGSLS
jgi:2-octaprenyl-6-methoxyphenol hydroxylase